MPCFSVLKEVPKHVLKNHHMVAKHSYDVNGNIFTIMFIAKRITAGDVWVVRVIPTP